MSRERKLKFRNRKLYRNILAAFLIICILMGGLCYQYYRRIQDTVKSESGEYMQEISKQIGTNISRTINDNFAILETISTVLRNTNITSYEQLQTIAREQKDDWKFHNLMLIGEDGVAYDAYGKKVALDSSEYLQEVVVNGIRSMSSAQVVNDKECIIFTIPLDDTKIGGLYFSALASSYELITFDRIISMTAFNGQGYAHVIRQDGTVAIRSSTKSAGQSGYNILTSLENAEFDMGSSIETLKSDIADRKEGQTTFTLNGVSKYMAYTPLEAQGWFLLTFVPVDVVNAKSELLLKITMLFCGFITLAFALLLAFLMMSFYRHKHKLEQIAYVDSITGGNTIQRFYDLAGKLLSVSGKPQYALVYMNIEKFKVLNEQFGRNSCDDILRGLEKGISADLSENECSGRLFADNFCILLKYENEMISVTRFEAWYAAAVSYLEKTGSAWLPLSLEFGVYIIGNDSLPFPQMIDRAKLSLRESTSERCGKIRYAVYDEEIRKLLFREKQLEDMMEDALKKGEFQVYFQPKYNTQSEEIGGAEALVRWMSSSEGMIYPDEFISLFERNGFIVQLDLWVFDQVCTTIHTWLDMGLEPIKISVNCSRFHLRNPNFLDRYREIYERNRIPAKYIEIELTENTVFENVELLTQTINDIHKLGFSCSMDDFGSGYSSLNLIQDIPVDTLKLDKIFFKNGIKDLQRTESVVRSIITMSEALSMLTVAEGVEERFHVDMLKRLGCSYIQGYYFARPMPIVEFERLAFGTRLNLEKEADVF